MWSVLSADFDTGLTKEKCLNNVLKNTTHGDIIVFHDSEKSFEKLQFVLPRVLEHFKNQGFEFCVIDA
jgi:peptidoglycan/xylan/chitin deacetylase (PgdA/CDA1 family)